KEPHARIPTKSFCYAAASHPALVALGNALALELFTPNLERIAKLESPELFSVAISKDASAILGGGYQTLHAWQRGGATAKPVASVSATIGSPRKSKKRDLESIAWLSAIGKKPRAKARIERLESIGDWPGMDKPEIAALNDLLVSM